MVEIKAMKKIVRIIIALSVTAAATFLASCKKNVDNINYNVLPGNGLYLPANEAERDLSDLQSTMFYWTPSIAEDNGFVSYDVLFDKVDGNFSKPLAVVNGQFNGSRPYVEMTAKQLNRIARDAGIGIQEKGAVKWTVRAGKGLNGVIYSQSNILNVTTMYSIDPLPKKLFLSGPAVKEAEGIDKVEMTVSRGIDKQEAGEGIFESFCKLANNRDLYLSDELGRNFVINPSGSISISEEPKASRLSFDSGVVWLNVDTDGMLWSSKVVSQIQLYAAAWADGKMTTANVTMSYAGNGKWQIKGYDNKTSKNSDNDSRYRFNATLSDGSKLYLGTEATLGAEYTTIYRIVNFYTKATIGNVDWDKTYNLLDKDCGVPCNVYLHLNSENPAGTFWHEFEF